MATTQHQAGVFLIGLGLGMVLNVGFSSPPLNVINGWIWLIPVLIGIILVIKT
jgi:hypothetical protein